MNETDQTSDECKRFSDYKRNELEEMLVGPPLDLSFKKVSNMAELAGKRPQTIRTGKAPIRTPKDRFVTSSLWLSNNSLISMKGLDELVSRVLDEPIYLSWLDLSFNEIADIDDEVTKFPNLKILYLHGNNISDINEIIKLRKLQNLRTLSMHGNPVETLPGYRGYIVHILPQLLCLDFSAIIATERKKPLPVGFFKMIRSSTLV